MNQLGKAMSAAVEAEKAPLLATIADLEHPDPGDDPDRKYDEERDRRMLGEEE